MHRAHEPSLADINDIVFLEMDKQMIRSNIRGRKDGPKMLKKSSVNKLQRRLKHIGVGACPSKSPFPLQEFGIG
jgi:hypothetical protein